MRYFSVFLALCLISLIAQQAALAWDGNWTHAKSGNERDLFDDPGRSDKQSGTDPPQKFWIPSVRDFADVDPEELHDYFDRKNRHYTPYALARIEQNIRYNNLTIPKGYYLIKPGGENAGSLKVNLQTVNGPLPMPQATTSAAMLTPAASPSLPPLETEVEEAVDVDSSGQLPAMPTPVNNPPPTIDPKAPIYQTFVMIRQGKVIGVVPIHRMSQYQRTDKKEKKPKTAMAWVEWAERRPVLKFYYRKWVYETEFQ